MPKSKNGKNHKKKAAARRKRLEQERRRVEKAKKEFINELIKQEQEKGTFENNKPIDDLKGAEGPQI